MLRHMVLLLCSIINQASFLDSQGPNFISEPPSKIDFSNNTGVQIECSASGSPIPSINWVSSDGKAIMPIPRIREILNNSSLLFFPFPASSFRQDVHLAVYRCIATNNVGKIISREIRVRAVVQQYYEVEAKIIGSKNVIRGNTAVLKCTVANSVRDFVTVTSWLQDSNFNIFPSIKGDGKYHMLPSGELLIRKVEELDKYHSYQCRIVNRISGLSQISSAIRMSVINSHFPVSPRLNEKQLTINARKDQSVVLCCITESMPTATNSWYKNSEIINGDERKLIVGDGDCVAFLHTQPEDSGSYLCIANNTAGSTRLDINLQVIWTTIVNLEPRDATVDLGQQTKFICSHSLSDATIIWLKDTQIIHNGGRFQTFSNTLIINRTERDDAGMYQCLVNNDQISIQSTAELRLGAAHPQLVYKFISQTLQPGPTVSLKCIATGNPTPQLRWTLDGFPLPHSERFMMGQYVTMHGDVISHVNISSVKVEDGGTYKCIAVNRVGETEHSAALRIYGMLSIREMPNVSAVAGEGLYITCPVAGYPIDTIIWEKNERKLPMNRRQHVFPNGTLLIENIQRESDAGTYSCTAINKQGRSATQRVIVNIIVPPRIMPFTFPTDLRVGDRVGVQCFITQGDLPMSIVWQQNTLTITSSINIKIQQVNSFVSSLTIESLLPQHTANYSCIASNNASNVHHSAQLLVNVPPRIGPFSFGELIEGVRTQVQCVIQQGDPPLNLTWLKDNYHIPRELDIQIEKSAFSSTLIIPVVKNKHSGNYTCVAKNLAKETSQFSSLIVNVPPRWLQEPVDQNVTRNNGVKFDCNADGFPKPDITWRKVIARQPSEYQDLTVRNRGIEIFSNGTLYIRHAFQEHQGEYLCEASNGIGADISAFVNLTVQVPPEFEIKSSQSNIRRGSPITLKCDLRGDGPMQISWQRKTGYKISPTDPRYHIKEYRDGGTFYSNLLIPNTLKSDSGVYVCIATNPFGSDSRNIHLLVQDAPGKVRDVRIIDSNSRSVRITWQAPFDNDSPVLQYVVQYHQDTVGRNNGSVLQSAQVTGTAMVALVAGLMPATLYRLRVIAENEQGPGEASEEILVHTESEPPEGTVQALNIEAISSTSLQVNWIPPPREQWNGKNLGYYVGYRETSSSRSTGYNFTTVPQNGGGITTNFQLKDLKKYKKYGIVVQAFNEKGSGPLSNEVAVETLEDVPTYPPIDIKCHSKSSQSLFINWREPPSMYQHGIIIGYKIIYENVDQDLFNSEIKITNELNTEIHGLQKYSNYSIEILAYTKVGDGEKSSAIFCYTDQDVPEAPAKIKVVQSGLSSVVVSWLPPDKPNGIITSYNVYTATGHEYSPVKKRLSASQTHCELHELRKKHAYEFWVTALTRVGEGPSTPVVYTSLTTKVSATILSFGQIISVVRKDRVVLPCAAIGVLTQDREWFGPNNLPVSSNRFIVQVDGSLLLNESIKTDEGNYTCIVRNQHGSDQIYYTLNVLVPPTAPILQIKSDSSFSIKLKWIINNNGGAAIRSYILNYRKNDGYVVEWEERILSHNINEYILTNLECGTEYYLNLIAVNRVGSGTPSETIKISTQGSIPTAPSLNEFLDVNITTITLNLNKWLDNECQISSFSIDYKEKNQDNWLTVSNKLKNKDKYSLSGLWPGTHYIIRVIATNSAGSTSAEYPISTFSPIGGTPIPSLIEDSSNNNIVHSNISIILISILIVLIFIIITSAIICICKRKQERTKEENRRNEENKSMFSLKQNINQGEQFYASTPVRNFEQITESEDIHPYATFQVTGRPQQPARFETFIYQDRRLPMKKSPAHPQCKLHKEHCDSDSETDISSARNPRDATKRRHNRRVIPNRSSSRNSGIKESKFITRNYPAPPTGFNDGHEISEAECDMDTLIKIKLRQQQLQQQQPSVVDNNQHIQCGNFSIII